MTQYKSWEGRTVLRENEGLWLLRADCPKPPNEHVYVGSPRIDFTDLAGCTRFGVPYQRGAVAAPEVSEFIELVSSEAAQEVWYEAVTEIRSAPPGVEQPSYENTELYWHEPGLRELVGSLSVRTSLPSSRVVRTIERVELEDAVQWHKISPIFEVCRRWEIPVA